MVALDTMRLLAGVGVFLTPIVASRPYGGVRAAASRRYRLAMTRMLKTSFSAAPMIGWSQPFTPLRAHERNAQSSGQGKLIISSWFWARMSQKCNLLLSRPRCEVRAPIDDRKVLTLPVHRCGRGIARAVGQTCEAHLHRYDIGRLCEIRGNVDRSQRFWVVAQ